MTALSVKPHLLRADTIDLQSQQSPSAKDHTRGQYNSGYNNGTTNHVQQTLRNANHDAYQEMQSSPRLGGFDQNHIHNHNHNGSHDQMHTYDDGDEDEEDQRTLVDGNHDGSYDNGNDSQDEDMDDELLDKISSSPSIEDEDIDFEFVYALHTFVATVEGQANATKGDTMVLLDDSNSYWWLVRVVKDASIGYLPAEHIETPTERLARLNKHRNIDLAAAMLGDNPEKSKNPLKKAIRRRNAKTVNFAPPTYYDADPKVWSDDEEEDPDADEPDVNDVENSTSQQEQQSQQSQQTQQNQSGQQGQQVIQSTESQRVQPVAATIHRVESNEDTEDDEPSSPVKSTASSQQLTQNDSQENVRKTKAGVVRNTDSFFRDDTVETKKISLTPRLLRNDTDSTTSTEHEVKRRASPDTFDRVVGEDKSKDKKKEKKGMLSGLFKRKDKSGKGARSDTDETDRNSEDSGRSPQSKESLDDVTPDKRVGKLQKHQQPIVSPRHSPTDTRAPQRDFAPTTPQQQTTTPPPKTQSEAAQVSQTPSEPQQQPVRTPLVQEKRSVFAPIAGALRSKSSNQEMGDSTVKPIYSKRAKERFAIEASDSEDDSTPTAQSSLHRSISPIEYGPTGNGRPDSEARVSPLDTREYNKAGDINTSGPAEEKERSGPSQQTNSTAAPTTPSDQTASTSKHSPSVATHTPSTSRSTPTWSDLSLRSYMDNDQDIRDLLVIVHDKSNVMPVGSEHPLMNGLFSSERTKLADMQSQLDSMLLSWLAKKQQPGGGSLAARG